MKEIQKIGDYTIVEYNQRYGLLFKGNQCLEPVYATLRITNEDVERKAPEWVRGDYLSENNCQIVTADGKQGLIYEGQLLTILEYTRIIKLTFCHYLCQLPTQYLLYYFSDIGYWRNSHAIIEHLATMSIHEELTVEVLLKALSETQPVVYKAFLELFDPSTTESGEYISHYRYYGGCIDDIDLRITVERVLMDNHFHITPYDFDGLE